MCEDKRPYLTESVWMASAERVDGETRQRGIKEPGRKSVEDGPMLLKSEEGEVEERGGLIVRVVEIPPMRVSTETWRRAGPVTVASQVEVRIERGRGEEKVRVPVEWMKERCRVEEVGEKREKIRKERRERKEVRGSDERREVATQQVERAGSRRGVWLDIQQKQKFTAGEAEERMREEEGERGERCKEKRDMKKVRERRGREKRKVQKEGSRLPPAPVGASEEGGVWTVAVNEAEKEEVMVSQFVVTYLVRRMRGVCVSIEADAVLGTRDKIVMEDAREGARKRRRVKCVSPVVEEELIDSEEATDNRETVQVSAKFASVDTVPRGEIFWYVSHRAVFGGKSECVEVLAVMVSGTVFERFSIM